MTRRSNLEQTKALHDAIRELWPGYRSQAPTHFKASTIFATSTPIIVTARVGQNQEVYVANPDHDALENYQRSWRNLRDYSKIRYMTVALATHIQCVLF